MAHHSPTAALLRVIQSSSGISQPTRLSHKACRWHTRITSIRISRTTTCHPCRSRHRPINHISHSKKWLRRHPDVGATKSSRATLRVSFVFSILHSRHKSCGPASSPYNLCRPLESLSSIILKALRMGLTAIGASLRPDESSTDPQLRPSLSVYIKTNI